MRFYAAKSGSAVGAVFADFCLLALHQAGTAPDRYGCDSALVDGGTLAPIGSGDSCDTGRDAGGHDFAQRRVIWWELSARTSD